VQNLSDNRSSNDEDTHAKKINRAKQLAESHSRIFNRDYIKSIEKNIEEERSFLGLSKSDIEEVMKTDTGKIDYKASIENILEDAIKSLEKSIADTRIQYTNEIANLQNEPLKMERELVEKYFDEQKRIVEEYIKMQKQFITSTINYSLKENQIDSADLYSQRALADTYTKFVITITENMMTATRLANTMILRNTRKY
jgi:hypothetical protein